MAERKRQWRVWVDRGTLDDLMRDQLVVGHLAIFPPLFEREKKRPPWRGLVRATLTLSPPPRAKRKTGKAK